MSLTKQIIHKQVEKIAQNFYGQERDISKALSRAYTHLCLRTILELSDDEASECVVDGGGDFKIDGIYFGEPRSDTFDIYLFQSKYSSNFNKDSGFEENAIIKMINSLRHIFFDFDQFGIEPQLKQKLVEINSYVADGYLPTVTVYFCNNGKIWAEEAQKYITSFLNESQSNKDTFEFQYINHETIFSLLDKNKKVDCKLTFKGKFIDEELNYKRAIIGTVAVDNIAEIMDQYGNSILQQNVRDFLGLRKSVNQGIKDTLEDKEKRKNFYFLNNGITFICQDLGYAPGNLNSTIAKLSDAQIINGGQTSKTIHRVLSDIANKNEDFSQTYVLVRVYKVGAVSDEELVHDITLATNSQNAISLRDLHANDSIQLKIEKGLQDYGVSYVRKRSHIRSSRESISVEQAAEVLLTTALEKPNEAKYRKGAHFGILYNQIFDEKKLSIEQLYLASTILKKIETLRKHEEALGEKYPFIPYSSFHLLLVIYQLLVKSGSIDWQDIVASIKTITEKQYFEKYYIAACDILTQAIAEEKVEVQDLIKIVGLLKSERFNLLLKKLSLGTVYTESINE